MKRVSVLAAFVMTAAAFVTGCSGETGGSSETGSVSVNLIIGNTNVTAVTFEVTCNGLTLNGQFNVNDEQDPPVWAAIMDLPPGPCTVTLTAFDDAGAPLCTGGPADFTVVANETVKVNIVLTCLEDGEELLGTVDIDATFEEVPANNCPRLHFLNVVPDEVPPEGSAVTVLVSDADGDTVTTALTATGGSFLDPSAQLTTYTCDDANGTQTVSVIASDGDPACDKTKSFDVTCPGVNPCEGVECPDTGNQCTVGICTNESAPDCVETNVPNDTACEAGGIDDVADNGGVEEGTLNGWTDQEFCVGICEATDTMPNTGVYSARMFNDITPSGSVLKQANKGIGIVQPNSQVTVRFAAKGNFAVGGVAIAEFFSEIAGGGTSKTETLGGGPFFTDTVTEYQLFEFIVTTGNDVSGGITLQFVAATGAATGSTSELFIDDVVIIVEGGGAGTCQEGVCEPSAECTVETVDADCPPTNNECIDPVCNAGTCGTSNNTNPCDGGNGTCSGGECVPIDLCEGNTCDDEDTECSDSSCDPATGECVATPINKDDPCDGGTGNCSSAGVCVPNPTANAFIKTLDPSAGFQVSLIDTVDTTNLPDTWGGYAASISIPDDEAFIGHILQFGFQTNASDFDSSGNFYDNVALNDPAVLYTQDFNGLDITGALIGDGWTFFNNVFDSAGTRKFGYGGAAPNGPQICALVAGQGGAGQEPQQLSVYSDYECCGPGTTNEGHFSGTDLVETNVFQERIIGADDLGKTFEFIFEAKGGNIGN